LIELVRLRMVNARVIGVMVLLRKLVNWLLSSYWKFLCCNGFNVLDGEVVVVMVFVFFGCCCLLWWILIWWCWCVWCRLCVVVGLWCVGWLWLWWCGCRFCVIFCVVFIAWCLLLVMVFWVVVGLCVVGAWWLVLLWGLCGCCCECLVVVGWLWLCVGSVGFGYCVWWFFLLFWLGRWCAGVVSGSWCWFGYCWACVLFWLRWVWCWWVGIVCAVAVGGLVCVGFWFCCLFC